MKQTNFKKILWVVLAIVMVLSILPISAIASGNRQASLTWTETTASITMEPGEAAGGDLKYKLTLSPELLKTLNDGENNGVSLSLQLPEGLTLPVSQTGEINISEDGSSLSYNDEIGKHNLISLSADTGWAIKISPKSLSIKQAGSKGENPNLAFFVGLEKKTQEKPAPSEAVNSKPEEPANDNGADADNTPPTDDTDGAKDNITPSDGTEAAKDSITPSDSTEAVDGNTTPDNNADTADTAETPTGDAESSSPDTTPDNSTETNTAGTTPNNNTTDSTPATTNSEPNRPVTLTITIPADVLKADKTFQGGKLTLTAQVGEITAKAETTAKLKDGVAPATPRGTIQKSQGFTTNIFWADNHDEANKRMSTENMATEVSNSITFTVKGKTYLLNKENMNYLGMTALPQATVTDNGVNAYTLSYPDNAFPTVLEEEEGESIPVTWSFSQPPQDGYDTVEVTEENIKDYPSLTQNESSYGWYYILKAPFSFDVVLRSGASYNGEYTDDGTYKNNGNLANEDLKNAVLNNFKLMIERPGNPKLVELPLASIGNNSSDYGFKYEVNTEESPEDAPDESDKIAKITVTNGWKYNINGARMEYKVIQNVGGTEGAIAAPKIDTGNAPVGVGEDQLKITYDNTGTTYASETDATYRDGKLILTLTGEAAYEATKEWQDQGIEKANRPKATLELWRYRNGQDLESAAPVRDKKNQIVQMELNEEDSQEIEFKADSMPDLDSLPKYDSDGYRYVYVVKEYLTGPNADKYQQVFGKITEEPAGSGHFKIEDTLPTWLPEIEGTTTKRTENNNYLYNGGTLSNCLNVNRKVQATKTWKAATFQADFKNVVVELTLQSRPKTESDNGIWSAATDENGKEIKRVKYGFTEENLAAWDVNATVPKYGLLGRILEYRWVETAVYQPEGEYNEETLKAWYESDESKTNLLINDGFTLMQNDRPVKYKSTTSPNIIPDTNTPQTIINELDNTINYTVIKKWGKDITPKEVSFAIFQIPSGEALKESDQPYLTFTMDEKGKVKENINKPADAMNITVENPEDTPWQALVKNLPEFDKNGAAYQYLLLEDKTTDQWVPDYETKRDKGNYTTTVTNNPGPGQRILIRKEWVDNSDISHREPVNIEVWAKGKTTPITTVTLAINDEWNKLVGIDNKYKLEDIYLKEVSVGEAEVAYEDGETWDNPAQVTGAYASNYHNYEVTYTELQDILGEKVLTVRNRRVNTVNFTITKQWKDNNGMLRKELAPALEKLPTDKKLTLSLRLKFATEVPETYEITRNPAGGDTVNIGVAPRPIQDNHGNPVQSIQSIDLSIGEDATTKYYFWNLPKYDATGAVAHYAVEEVWLDGGGHEVELEKYLKENLAGYPGSYPDLAEMVKEYSFSITGQSYTAGESTDGAESGTEIAAAYAREKAIVPDTQTAELTNRLSGTKSVYWHKLWDDAYAYSEGNRPDIYLDIYQMVHREDETGKLTQYVTKYIKDYRWDSSTNQTIEDEVIGRGDPTNHWHVILDNLPKYDEETGREYYYYAVERAKVNIKQYDYADVTYYISEEATKNSKNGDGIETVNTDWPDTGRDQLTKIGTARSEIDAPYLKFNYNDPAEAYAVPEEYRETVPPYKYYQYPSFMLLEGGYFSNTLEETVTIEGRKLWQALPNSYPATDLPAIKFSVYRSLETDLDNSLELPTIETKAATSKEFVATLTVKDWADAADSGTYPFEINYYTDKDGNLLDSNGAQVSSVEAAAKLPQYDEHGHRYVYTLVEDSIIWADGTETKVSKTAPKDGTATDERAGIFDTTQPGEKNFVATNAYKGVMGSLTVKKILELETKKSSTGGTTEYVYPAVKFKLERYYYPSESYKDGTPSGDPIKDDNFKQEKILTSDEVKTAHQKDDPDVSCTLTFDNLEKYAPNGSEYLYTVTEDDSYLAGYDTWVAEGDIDKNAIKTTGVKGTSIGELIVTAGPVTNPQPAATFLNEFIKPNDPENSEKYPIVFQKVWRDYDNIFDLRPETIKVELIRYANPQPGQNNGIARELFATIDLPTKENYKDQFNIEFTEGSGYTDTMIEFSGFQTNPKVWLDGKAVEETVWQWKLESFAQYAPNGMPWTYITKEKETTPYTINGNELWGWWNKDDVFTGAGSGYNWLIPAMVNSIYKSVPFEKHWTDKDGKPITNDYLGNDLTVIFGLQVKEAGTDTWADADTYFTANLTPENLEKMKKIRETGTFTATKTGRVNAAVWSGSFDKLPTVIKKTGETETTPLSYRVVEKSVEYGTKEQTITPADYIVIGDGLVKAATFEETGNVTTNKLNTTSLTVQKIWSGDSFNQYNTRPNTEKAGSTWETTFVIQRSTDADNGPWNEVTKVTLSGTNDKSTAEATIAGLPTTAADGSEYIYRARELEPNTTDKIVENTGDAYYNGAYTVTYDEEQDAKVIATNVLNQGSSVNETYANYAAEKTWYPTEKPADEGDRSATFALQYLSGDGNTWKTLAKVEMDGKEDTNLATGDETDDGTKMVYGENDPWHAIWQDIPLRHPDSYMTGTETTIYRVVETNHTPADYIALNPDPVSSDETCTFRFTNIRSTALNVEKNWIGTSDENKKEIVVGLYRTTDPKDIGKADDNLAVKDTNDEQLKQTLRANTGADDMKGTFSNLPAYNDKGEKYFYYALELSVGGKPTAESGFSAVYDNETKPNTTIITNVFTTSISGTKTWLDNSNSEGSRPDSLTLKLERRAGDDEEWEEVPLATPVWSDTDKDIWKYTYTGLPTASPEDLSYQYRVTEDVPEGYVQINTDNDNSFVNVLQDVVSFTVTKEWADNNGTDRPESLVLTLYRSTTGVNAEDQEALLDVTTPEPVKNENEWIYAYSDLQEYNEVGVRYTYWVEETVPSGYDAKVTMAENGGVLENIRQGGLKVRKIVSGNRSEADREFHFKVTLSGTSTANIPATEINIDDGNVSFRNGVAEFTLKNEESMLMTNLPAGLNYTVEEIEANEDGYTTTIQTATGTVSDGQTAGEILPGEQTEITFENNRHYSPPPTTTIKGTKTWADNDNAAGLRPDTLELILYRSTHGGKEEKVEAEPTWSKNGNLWTYSYDDLPASTDDGTTYVYRVEEVLPQGYTARYLGSNIINTLIPANDNGSLTVSKTVSGSKGDVNKAFHFTVKLGDKSINGVYGGMTFQKGEASFTLKHGESITAKGLPTGVSYTVTEIEANKDGYVTTVTGGKGTIREETATAAFVNKKDAAKDTTKPTKTEKSNDKTPKTNDPTTPGMWLLLSLTSLGLALALIDRKRRKERETK